jgi:hypothetical protein
LSAGAQGVLWESLNDCVSPSHVWAYAGETGVVDPADRCAMALGMVIELLSRDLMIAGDVGDAFYPWECSTAESIERICREWLTGFAGRSPDPGDIFWLKCTPAGEALARGLGAYSKDDEDDAQDDRQAPRQIPGPAAADGPLLSIGARSLLWQGLDDWLSPPFVYEFAADTGPREPFDLQAMSYGILAEVLVHGLMEAGDVDDDFQPWKCSAGQTLDRIAREWQADFPGEKPIARDIFMLNLTSAGQVLAAGLGPQGEEEPYE